MNDHTSLKQQLIRQLAEQGAPADYDPWLVIKKRLNESRGSKTAYHSFQSPSRGAIAGIMIALFLLLTGAVFFMTPSGQATAQSLLNLFRKAESDVQPDPYDRQAEPLPPTATIVPTRMIGIQPVTPEPDENRGTGFFTPTPVPSQVYGDVVGGVTLAEAEELARFEAIRPADLPDGYSLAFTTYDAHAQAISQIYKFKPYQAGELFVLTQQLTPPNEAVGSSAKIESFQIGETLVEHVAGAWFGEAGSGTTTWTPSAVIRTFRWQQEGFYMTLQFMLGDTFSPAYLPEEEMEALVGVILGAQATLPEGVNLNNLKNLEEVEKASGLQLLAPNVLPEGFVFSQGVYEPENKRIILIYSPEEGSRASRATSLTIFEFPLTPSQEQPNNYAGYPAGAVEEVNIGLFTGTFVRGAVVNGSYDPDEGLSVSWQTAELRIIVRFTHSSMYADRIEKEEIIRIAESME